VSITLDILTALADHPDGEASVDTIKGRLIEAAMNPGRLAELVGNKRGDVQFRLRTRGPNDLQNLFSDGLVERPRPGIWKLTSKGRDRLDSFRSRIESRTR
jgi:restriction endonuclease Mrr